MKFIKRITNSLKKLTGSNKLVDRSPRRTIPNFNTGDLMLPVGKVSEPHGGIVTGFGKTSPKGYRKGTKKYMRELRQSQGRRKRYSFRCWRWDVRYVLSGDRLIPLSHKGIV